jgi:hypothetical protein
VNANIEQSTSKIQRRTKRGRSAKVGGRVCPRISANGNRLAFVVSLIAKNANRRHVRRIANWVRLVILCVFGLGGRVVGGDIKGDGCRDGLALAGGLEALEFVEGTIEATFDVGFVPMEFADDVVSLNLPGNSLAERNGVHIVLGRGKLGAKDGVDGILLGAPVMVLLAPQGVFEHLVQHLGFHAVDATQAPGGGDDAFGQKIFEGFARSELTVKMVAEGLVLGRIFTNDQLEVSAQAVTTPSDT